jgi:hypothetical protein
MIFNSTNGLDWSSGSCLADVNRQYDDVHCHYSDLLPIHTYDDTQRNELLASFGHDPDDDTDNTDDDFYIRFITNISGTELDGTTISFQSINGQENNTITSDIITHFNWTKVDNTSYYTLSASNNSDMSSPIYNITIHTSDSNCWDNSTGYIEYVLPEAYRTTWNKYYYYQVSAYYA